jgi:hypothetical protein
LTTDFSESLGTDFYLLEDRLTDQERAKHGSDSVSL